MTDAAATATTAPQGAPAGAEAAPPETSWYDSFPDEVKGYVENKGWKDPVATVESYRNLEKLVGAPPEQILRLPKGDADPSEWDSVWNKLGRPAEPKGYEFSPDLGLDENLTEWAQETFHKLGLPKNAAEGVLKEYLGLEELAMQREEEAYQERTKTEAASLQKEWGAAFEQNASVAKAAAVKLGMDEQTVDALERVLGFKKTLELFHGIGSRTGESDFVSSGTAHATGVMTPSAARSRIAALRADPGFVQRYTSNEVGAMEEMKRLHEWAYPE